MRDIVNFIEKHKKLHGLNNAVLVIDIKTINKVQEETPKIIHVANDSNSGYSN